WIGIKEYLRNKDLLSRVRQSGAKCVFVAPTLGLKAEAGVLFDKFNEYLYNVCGWLRDYGPFEERPRPRNVVLAAHSGGGREMLKGATRYPDLIKECWGFDCVYGAGPPESYHKRDLDAWINQLTR